jgi:flagellar biosynthetic protein FliR
MFEVYTQQFILFVMLFVRITATLVTAPLLGHQSIPAQTKIGLGLFVAYVMYPIAAHQTAVINQQLAGIVLIALKETMVGVLIGFTLGIVFAGVRYAGELISSSMGFNAANMFDPESTQTMPVLGEFMYMITLLIFLLINGHHFVFEALYVTFKAVPIGMLTFSEPLMQSLIHLTGMMFVVGVKIAAPVLVAIFLTNVGLSILARVMPQANILMMSFPITISVGLLVLFSSTPLLIVVFKKLLLSFENNIMELIRLM